MKKAPEKNPGLLISIRLLPKLNEDYLLIITLPISVAEPFVKRNM